METTRRLSDYLLFAEAWIFLLVARGMLALMPFRKIASRLGRDVSQEGYTIMKIPRARTAASIGMAIDRGRRYTPFRTRCFESAIAAKLMLRLRRMPSAVFFGVHFTDTNTPEKMKAHAWLQCGKHIITGAKEAPQFNVVGIFYS